MATWGVALSPGKVAPFVPPPEGGRLHLSQAVLVPPKEMEGNEGGEGGGNNLHCLVFYRARGEGSSGRDGETGGGSSPELALAALRCGSASSSSSCDNVPLDLIFDEYTEFRLEVRGAKGNAAAAAASDVQVHLTGYHLPDFGGEEDGCGHDHGGVGEEEEEEEELSDEEDLALARLADGSRGALYDSESEDGMISDEDDDSEDDDSESESYSDEEDDDESDLSGSESDDEEEERDTVPSSVVIEELGDDGNDGDDKKKTAGDGKVDTKKKETGGDDDDDGGSSSSSGSESDDSGDSDSGDDDSSDEDDSGEEGSGDDEPDNEPVAAAPAWGGEEKAKEDGASAKRKASDAAAAANDDGENANKKRKPAAVAPTTPPTATASAAAAAEASKKQQQQAQKQKEQQQAQKLKEQQQQQQQLAQKLREQQQAASEQQRVRRFDNGFVIETLASSKSATAPMAKAGKKIKVRYVGKLAKTGKIFDQTKGAATFGFRLGVGEVIKGWDRGCEGMRVGDKRRLTVPPQMGYGSSGIRGVIPGNATLVFDVELVGVH